MLIYIHNFQKTKEVRNKLECLYFMEDRSLFQGLLNVQLEGDFLKTKDYLIQV